MNCNSDPQKQQNQFRDYSNINPKVVETYRLKGYDIKYNLESNASNLYTKTLIINCEFKLYIS